MGEGPGIDRGVAEQSPQGNKLMSIGDDINTAIGKVGGLPDEKKKAGFLHFVALVGRSLHRRRAYQQD